MDKMRITRLVAVLSVTTLLVAACGGDDSSNTTAAPSETASTDPAPQTDPAPTAPPETEPPNDPLDGDPEMSKVVFAGSQPNAGNWVLQVGEAEGIFADYGVELEMFYSGSSSAALAALFGRSAQFTSATYDAAILAHLQNDDLIIVAGGYNVAPFNLVTAREVASVNDLAGQTCSVGNAADVGDGIYLQMMIEGASGGELTYPDDYDIVVVPSAPGPVLGALEAGQTKCHAMISPSSSLLNAEGYPSLVRAGDIEELSDYYFFGISVTRSWAASNPITMDRFLQGYLASIAWIYDPANKQRALEILAENASIDLEVAETSYEWVEVEGYPKDGAVLPENIRRTVEVQQQFNNPSLALLQRDVSETLLDSSYLESAWERLDPAVRSLLEG